ncbi:cilia- and flagella-associated protein 58 isoform X2 [Cardiocondyla obscurior]
MNSNEALAPFEAEYTKLYESLYKAHKNEKEILGQCALLKNEIVENTHKMLEMKEKIKNYENEMTHLKEEITKITKLSDVAHAREQNAQEILQNLQLNITKLDLEVEQKNKQLASEKDTTVTKKRENLLKEKEILIGEMETMRQRIKNISIYAEEVEKKNNEIKQQVIEMQGTIKMQLNDILREKKKREKAEAEMQKLEEEIIVKNKELEAAKTSIKATTNNVARLENLIGDQKVADNKMQKEINKLILNKINLQTDLDNAINEINKLEKELTDKEKAIKNIKYDLNRTKEDNAKCEHRNNVIDKRLVKAQSERSGLEHKLKQAVINIKDIEHNAEICRKEQFENKQRVEILLREKNTIARNKETALKRIKHLSHELFLCGRNKKKIELEVDTLTQTIDNMRKQTEVVVKERDRYTLAVQELQQQLETYIYENKHKQREIFDYKKRLADSQTKYRQHQSFFEMARAEQNLCNKSLVEAQEQVRDLKSKLKITNQQIEQLKESIAMKEASLAKEEFLLGKIEKEKEELNIDLRASRTEIYNLRQQIEEAKKEEKNLQQIVQQADVDIERQKKDIDKVMNERDILGAQLVRRNDELGLHYSRIKVLNKTLQCGEIQYSQRQEDIRLLKFEVKKLKTEKMLLAKNIFNNSNLRQEAFHLNRNLIKEKLKVIALEEETQTPFNIHRWRKLEGTDPTTFELIKKTDILQKRILKMSTGMINKDRKLKEIEKLCINLCDVLSKQPNLEIINMNKIQNLLRKRKQKINCLVAELNMYESQVTECKEDITTMTNETFKLKKKYHTQNKNFLKIKKETLNSTYKTIFPDISAPKKKIYGGGFKIMTPSNICCIVNTSTSK